MWIVADIIVRRGIYIGKVAASAAADANFLAWGLCVVDDQTAAWRLGCAYHAGRAGSNNNCIIIHR